MKSLFNFHKSKVDVSTVPSLDLERYLGSWHEIARFDHWFERGLSKATAEYSMQGNNRIKVVNRGFNTKQNKEQEATGRAKLTDQPGRLRVAFFWNFYSDYCILSLGENYDWALVASGNSGKYMWILSRTETLSEETLNSILAEAKHRNFDVSKLIFN